MAQVIVNIMAKAYLGPSPVFSELHIYKALQLLGDREMLGRTALASQLHLGSGAVRTLIRRLKQAGLISVTKGGCILTGEGYKTYLKLKEKIPQSFIIKAKIVSDSRFHAALLVRDAAEKVRKGLEQRDAAVRVGAKGAVTLICREGHFILPPDRRETSRIRASIYWRKILSRFDIQDGDVVIVCGADSPDKAEYGALAAAWTLI